MALQLKMHGERPTRRDYDTGTDNTTTSNGRSNAARNQQTKIDKKRISARSTGAARSASTAKLVILALSPDGRRHAALVRWRDADLRPMAWPDFQVTDGDTFSAPGDPLSFAQYIDHDLSYRASGKRTGGKSHFFIALGNVSAIICNAGWEDGVKFLVQGAQGALMCSAYSNDELVAVMETKLAEFTKTIADRFHTTGAGKSTFNPEAIKAIIKDFPRVIATVQGDVPKNDSDDGIGSDSKDSGTEGDGSDDSSNGGGHGAVGGDGERRDARRRGGGAGGGGKVRRDGGAGGGSSGRGVGGGDDGGSGGGCGGGADGGGDGDGDGVDPTLLDFGPGAEEKAGTATNEGGGSGDEYIREIPAKTYDMATNLVSVIDMASSWNNISKTKDARRLAEISGCFPDNNIQSSSLMEIKKLMRRSETFKLACDVATELNLPASILDDTLAAETENAMLRADLGKLDKYKKEIDLLNKQLEVNELSLVHLNTSHKSAVLAVSRINRMNSEDSGGDDESDGTALPAEDDILDNTFGIDNDLIFFAEDAMLASLLDVKVRDTSSLNDNMATYLFLDEFQKPEWSPSLMAESITLEDLNMCDDAEMWCRFVKEVVEAAGGHMKMGGRDGFIALKKKATALKILLASDPDKAKGDLLKKFHAAHARASTDAGSEEKSASTLAKADEKKGKGKKLNDDTDGKGGAGGDEKGGSSGKNGGATDGAGGSGAANNAVGITKFFKKKLKVKKADKKGAVDTVDNVDSKVDTGDDNGTGGSGGGATGGTNGAGDGGAGGMTTRSRSAGL